MREMGQNRTARGRVPLGADARQLPREVPPHAKLAACARMRGWPVFGSGCSNESVSGCGTPRYSGDGSTCDARNLTAGDMGPERGSLPARAAR
jgi:hypothetical protein